MRTGAWILCLGLLARIAAADVVVMKEGGRLSGELKEVEIAIDATTSFTLGRSEVEDVLIRAKGRDEVNLKDGRTLIGRVARLHFRGPAGLLKLKREQLQRLTVGPSRKSPQREEFEKRWKQLHPDDAVGFYQLGQWCRKNQLPTPALRCMRKSLEIDPKHPFADAAHRAVGHVRYHGQWMTPGEKQALYDAECRARGLIKYHGHWRESEDIRVRREREGLIRTQMEAKVGAIAGEYNRRETALLVPLEELAAALRAIEQEARENPKEIKNLRPELERRRREYRAARRQVDTGLRQIKLIRSERQDQARAVADRLIGQTRADDEPPAEGEITRAFESIKW